LGYVAALSGSFVEDLPVVLDNCGRACDDVTCSRPPAMPLQFPVWRKQAAQLCAVLEASTRQQAATAAVAAAAAMTHVPHGSTVYCVGAGACSSSYLELLNPLHSGGGLLLQAAAAAQASDTHNAACDKGCCGY
jgi:hypothetical protein